MSLGKILIVDDDPDLLHLLALRLTTAGYDVCQAGSGMEALGKLRQEKPQVVVSDVRMDNMDGHELFQLVHAEAPSIPVILITAHGTIPDAVAATQRGVFGFLTKPFDPQELLNRVGEAARLSPPLPTVDSDYSWRQELQSISLVMEELFRQAHRAAEDRQNILIRGGAGSGKTLLAEAIHRLRHGPDTTLAVVDCASLGEEREEEALFGTQSLIGAGCHERTILIEDVDDLSPSSQARLLPMLMGQDPLEKAFGYPFAAVSPDIRVIATTRRPLERVVEEGGFRADLYYRLAESTLLVPALEHRKEDIPLLVAYFIRQAGGAKRSFAPESLALMGEARWPGNVRQLRSVVERACDLSVSPVIGAGLVRRLMQEEYEREIKGLEEARREFERDYLVRLLQSTNGNVTVAARIAQRNRTEFYKLLSKHELDPTAFKGA